MTADDPMLAGLTGTVCCDDLEEPVENPLWVRQAIGSGQMEARRGERGFTWIVMTQAREDRWATVVGAS